MKRVLVVIAMVTGVLARAAAVSSTPVVMTIEEFVRRAQDEGVAGKSSSLSLEAAGYTKRIAYRQTDSPTFTAGYRHREGESKVNGVSSSGQTDVGDVTMRQTTPLGTELSATGEYGDPTQGPASGAGGKPDFSATATQPLYIFVKNPVARTRRRASISFADAQYTFESTRLNIRSRARGLYYDVMLGVESIQVEQRKVASSQKLLDVTQALVDAGKTAPVETMRAKIRLQRDQRLLHNALVTKDRSVLTAKNFVYLPLDQDIQFVTQLEFAPFRVPLRRLIEYGMLHRPALKQLRNAVDRARLDLEAAVEPTRPTVNLTGSYNYSDQSNTLTRGWTWGAIGNWTFFDSFITRDQVRVARIATYVANLNLSEAERTTQADIRNTYMDLRRNEKQIQDFQQSREQARHNVEVLRLRFQKGLERLIDVFDAETEVRNLENEYLNLVVQFNRSKDLMSELIGTEVDRLQ